MPERQMNLLLHFSILIRLAVFVLRPRFAKLGAKAMAGDKKFCVEILQSQRARGPGNQGQPQRHRNQSDQTGYQNHLRPNA